MPTGREWVLGRAHGITLHNNMFRASKHSNPTEYGGNSNAYYTSQGYDYSATPDREKARMPANRKRHLPNIGCTSDPSLFSSLLGQLHQKGQTSAGTEGGMRKYRGNGRSGPYPASSRISEERARQGPLEARQRAVHHPRNRRYPQFVPPDPYPICAGSNRPSLNCALNCGRKRSDDSSAFWETRNGRGRQREDGRAGKRKGTLLPCHGHVSNALPRELHDPIEPKARLLPWFGQLLLPIKVFRSLLVQRKMLSTAAVSSMDSNSLESSGPEPFFVSSMDSSGSDLGTVWPGERSRRAFAEQRRLSLLNRQTTSIPHVARTERDYRYSVTICPVKWRVTVWTRSRITCFGSGAGWIRRTMTTALPGLSNVEQPRMCPPTISISLSITNTGFHFSRVRVYQRQHSVAAPLQTPLICYPDQNYFR